MPTAQFLRDQIRAHTVFPISIISDAQADVFIGTALMRTINAHDWQIQQATSALMDYPVDAASGVALPADFIREDAVYRVTGTPAALNLEPLSRVERQQFVRLDTAADASATYPAVPFTGPSYYVWSGALYVVPNPTETWCIQIDYIRDFTVVADTNPFIATYGLTVLSGALREAYLWLHEDERAATHDKNFGDLLGAAMKRDTSARVGGSAKRTR